MKKRGFPLSQRHKNHFYEKRAPSFFFCSNNKTSQKHTHAKEDVFHFDSLRFADDGFCAQKDRRELARVQVRANDVSLFTRKFCFLFFLFFFKYLFSPLLGVMSGPGKRVKRFGCGPSLSWGVHREWGSIGPIAKDESGREGGGLCCCCFLVGRTLLLVVVSKEVLC